MKKSSLALLWSTLFIMSLSINVWGASFTVNFSDIELDNLKPGMPVSLLQKASFPLTVTNTENNSENMHFEVILPEQDQLKDGYQPIPDVTWIKFEKDNFWLKPNQSEDLDMVIYTPYDQKLFGKKYEAILVSYTLEGMMKVNLKSKIFIAFNNDHYPPSVVNDLIAEDSTNNNALLIAPKLVSLDQVKLNKNLEMTNIMVTNTGAQNVTLTFYSVGLANFPAIAGFVTFKNPVIELRPRETKLVPMAFNLPLLRAKTSEPMLVLIGAKDTKKTTPLGQFMLLDLNFR